ncbi:hypothetical protein NPIL_363341 [Nephila pilipes]|uniref:Uncharacterized protein n=1 Tax=Nephila pilipes TaxID=299642 RepID=A0A8X6IYQ4_NEPPI|nr:hypothetical protein NPIL_363341 [Nephila pilipes]
MKRGCKGQNKISFLVGDANVKEASPYQAPSDINKDDPLEPCGSFWRPQHRECLSPTQRNLERRSESHNSPMVEKDPGLLDSLNLSTVLPSYHILSRQTNAWHQNGKIYV